MKKLTESIPGLLLCIIIGIAAILLSKIIPLLGGTTLALFFGMLIGNIIGFNNKFSAGISFIDKKLLPLTIVLFGVEIQSHLLLTAGFRLLVFVISIIIITILSSILIGRLFRMSLKSSILLGCGNAICGSSAIASITKIIKGSAEDTGLSIAAVNLMGTFGLLLYPFIAGVFQLDDFFTANLIGGNLQAVGQVVAAGYLINDEVGQIAVLIKMTRIMMLGPVIIIISLVFRDKQAGRSEKNDHFFNKCPVPLFIIGFFILSLLSNTSVISSQHQQMISQISGVLLTISMAAIGMNINYRFFRKCGKKIIYTESLIMIIQLISSCVLIKLIYSL